MAKKLNYKKLKMQAMLDNPEKRAKYKGAGVAAIIFACVAVLLCAGIVGFVTPSINTFLQIIFAGFRMLICLFIWGIALVLLVFSLTAYSVTGGNFSIFGHELFALGLYAAIDKTSIIFISVIICLCILLFIFTLASLFKAIKQLKVNKRKLSYVAITFSIVSIIMSLSIIIYVTVIMLN